MVIKTRSKNQNNSLKNSRRLSNLYNKLSLNIKDGVIYLFKTSYNFVRGFYKWFFKKLNKDQYQPINKSYNDLKPEIKWIIDNIKNKIKSIKVDIKKTKVELKNKLNQNWNVLNKELGNENSKISDKLKETYKYIKGSNLNQINKYYCDYCNYSNKSKINILNHYRICNLNPDNKLNCKFCNLRFISLSQLNIHLRSCSYVCEYCDFKTKIKKNLKKHKPHCVKRHFFCKTCCLGFPNLEHYLYHEKSCIMYNKKIYFCKYCNYESNRTELIASHTKLLHTKWCTRSDKNTSNKLELVNVNEKNIE